MVVVSHLFLFFEDKFQGQARLIRVTPAPVSDYLFPDSPFSYNIYAPLGIRKNSENPAFFLNFVLTFEIGTFKRMKIYL